MTDLTKAQKRVLKRFGEFLDGAVVDQYGRVLADGETRHDGLNALRLVARGLITGKDGRLYITGQGRKVLDRLEY